MLFTATKISRIINGKIISGDSKLILLDATPYLRNMRKANMLLLKSYLSKTNIDTIKKCLPCAIVTDRTNKELLDIDGCTIILVDNFEVAYWRFVNYDRYNLNATVVAITGTTGKTTTAEMVQHVLKKEYNVVGTRNSANGSTANLKYLLKMNQATQFGIFEIGVARPGTITKNCRYFKPSIGVITNIDVAHLDKCKTPQAYLNAKAEMVKVLPKDGTLILNADDINVMNINTDKFSGIKITYGIKNGHNLKAYNIKYFKKGMKFKLKVNMTQYNNTSKKYKLKPYKNKYNVCVPGYGKHQIYNALAALAVAIELGIDLNYAIRRLSSFNNLCLHLQIQKGINNCVILNDTWNLTPMSLKSGLQTLNDISNGKKRIAVIGQIDRLGDYSLEIIQEISNYIEKLDIDMLIVFGETGKLIHQHLKGKSNSGKVYSFSNFTNAKTLLKKTLNRNTILFAKCHMHDYAFRKFLKGFVKL